MARPRRQTYTMAQYLENVREGYISNNADTQRNPAWKPIVDGLVVTILTDDYIPAVILAEEESGEKKVVDGGSRTIAWMEVRYCNYKIKSSVENPIIKYKAMTKDDNGKSIWEEKEFDIRNKTFEQFPKELQKAFDEYQVETVIHECDSEGIAMYLRRYNVHTAMNANQKMFIYLPKFAGKVREITNRPFFINNSGFTDSEKEKGVLERVVSEAVMCMFHLDKWNKNGKNMATHLNNYAAYEEFEILESNISILEDIITDDLKDIFNSKDSFIWLTAFNNFRKLGLEDIRFAEFLQAFKSGLRDKEVDGQLFDTVDQSGSTKDKAIIIAKLHILETLMNEFLLINKEDLEEVDTFEFVKENVSEELTEEDIQSASDLYEDLKVEVPNDSKLLNPRNNPSMIAIMTYAERENMTLPQLRLWFVNYFAKNNTFLLNQKQNYLQMVTSLQKGASA